jgi:hopanoid biosynthesis associated protein HpnK
VKRLVVTGDDFGSSREVNGAIAEAHEHGLLTSASLMVAGPTAEEAVALARSHPGLAVGLHLVVVDGRASLPKREIPLLVDDSGHFPSNALAAGLRYQFLGAVRRQLRREIRSQLEGFRRTGLRLSHVDGHHHMHLHPYVLGVLAELAPEFGIRWIRLPSEELRFALAADRRGAAGKIFWSLVYRGLRRMGERRLRAAKIEFSDRVYGLLLTGRVDERYLLDLIPRIRADRVELYCHPARSTRRNARDREPSGPDELAALTSGRVREAVARSGFMLTNFEGLSFPPASGRLTG